MRRPLATLALALGLTACAPAQPLISSFTPTAPAEPIEGLVYSLPLARLQVTVDTSTGTFVVTPVLVPDPAATYVLNAQFGPASTDDVDLTTSNQLLSSINATTTDRTPAIVSAILEQIPAASLSKLRRGGAGGTIKGTALIDPYSPQTGLFQVSAVDPSIFRRAGGLRDRCPPGSSVCVPMLTPVTVRLRTGTFDASAIAMVPDPTRVIGIDLRQTACSQTTNALTFQNGILTKYDVTRPSAVAECLSIPLKIISEVFAAPLKFLQDEKGLIEAETHLVTAQTKLLDAQLALAAAQDKAAAAAVE